MIIPPTYPARPVKGGPLPIAIQAGLFKEGYRFEPKVNGWRATVHTPSGKMFNRHGVELSIAGEFSQALANLRESPFDWLDVEGLDRRHSMGRGSLIVLDWINQFETYDQRRQILKEFFNTYCFGQEILFDAGDVHLIPSGDCAEGGLKLWEILPNINHNFGCTFYEGVVAKRGGSLYPIQLRSDSEEFASWSKHRFTTSP